MALIVGGVTVIKPVRIPCLLMRPSHQWKQRSDSAGVVMQGSPALPPGRPRHHSISVCLLAQAWMSLRSPLSMGIRSEPCHTHTPLTLPHLARGLYYCVGMLWVVQPVCGCVCRSDKLCVSFHTLISHRYGSIEAEPCALAVQSKLFPEQEGTQLMSCCSQTCCFLTPGTGTLCEFLWLTTFLKLNS